MTLSTTRASPASRCDPPRARCGVAIISTRTRKIRACTPSCHSTTMRHGVIDCVRMAVSQPPRRGRIGRAGDSLAYGLCGHERRQLSHRSPQSDHAHRSASAAHAGVVAQISPSPHIMHITTCCRRSRERRRRSLDGQSERGQRNGLTAFRQMRGGTFRKIRRRRSTAGAGTLGCSTHRPCRDQQHFASAHMELQAPSQSSHSSRDRTSVRNRRITVS